MFCGSLVEPNTLWSLLEPKEEGAEVEESGRRDQKPEAEPWDPHAQEELAHCKPEVDPRH